MTLTKSQIKAAKAWARAMIDELQPLQPANDKPWTKFEVGEYHEAGCQAVRREERERLNALFDAAGREAGLVEFLNAEALPTDKEALDSALTHVRISGPARKGFKIPSPPAK